MNRRQELLRCAEQNVGSTASRSDAWIDQELADCRFSDARHSKRFRILLQLLSSGVGSSIPWICQDWANTKAAYRFFSNDRVSEEEILVGHFQSTRERFVAHREPVLILHDTTEFVYYRDAFTAIGVLTDSNAGRDSIGRLRHHTVCGISMHSSLAVTLKGLPLGLTAIKFWTRDKLHGCSALKKKVNPTRVPIEKKESIRWLENVRQSTELLNDPEHCVHIGDRESDIYELFCTAHQLGTHFLVRTCVDRLAGDGTSTIASKMKQVRVQGLHRIQVRGRRGELSEAVLEIRYSHLVVCPPIAKQKQ